METFGVETRGRILSGITDICGRPVNIDTQACLVLMKYGFNQQDGGFRRYCQGGCDDQN